MAPSDACKAKILYHAFIKDPLLGLTVMSQFSRYCVLIEMIWQAAHSGHAFTSVQPSQNLCC